MAEKIGQPFLELLFDALALDPDLAHGLEVPVLIVVAACAIGKLEKRVIDGIKGPAEQVGQPRGDGFPHLAYLARQPVVVFCAQVGRDRMNAGLFAHG